MTARVVVVHGADALHDARTRAGARDIIIPPADALARAFHPITRAGGDIPPHVRHVMLGAVAGAQRRAVRLAERGVTVWIVHPDATPAQLHDYTARGWELEKVG